MLGESQWHNDMVTSQSAVEVLIVTVMLGHTSQSAVEALIVTVMLGHTSQSAVEALMSLWC